MQVIKRDGLMEPIDIKKISACVAWACDGLNVEPTEVEANAHIMFFDKISTDDIQKSLIKSAAELISIERPDYSYAAARLVLQRISKEVTGGGIHYPDLRSVIQRGVDAEIYDERLLDFDLEQLDKHIEPSRDLKFAYMGMQTIYDRYLMRDRDGKLIEMPQHWLMRVAMGLALTEKPADRTKWVVEFYDVLSQFKYFSSTPTLFNAGTRHPQMSSCYGNTVNDQISADLGENKFASIFGTIEECARLSKFAGGIGTDWTRVRPAGEHIKSTNGVSSGVVPYLRIYNDTAIAVNQGGKRNGAFAAYLEPWHADVLRFIDLKKNVGDERLRAHEIYPALWMNDLFLERYEQGGMWSLFSAHAHEHLHELYGDEFKEEYERLEAEGAYMSQIPAKDLWMRILASMMETGAPWITFKDECNRRNPQMHAGVIHNSNLCTEITLNNSDDETFVCNLGSVNMCEVSGPEELAEVIPIAMRMLDNVIDENFYPSDRARAANMRHRPVGLGMMGYMDYLVRNGVDFESAAAVLHTQELFDEFSYQAIKASMELAKERGAYESFQGSLWSHGFLPIDSGRWDEINEFMREWNVGVKLMTPGSKWEELREDIVKYGMRNSNCMAIAPTATISNITGSTPCIEPLYKRAYLKENQSGLFMVVDRTLKYGRPELCKTSFEVDQRWVILLAAVRQLFIDQAQSTNLFAKNGTLGRNLDLWYRLANRLGLKTTYYLRNETDEIDQYDMAIKSAEGVNKQDASKPLAQTQSDDVLAGVVCSIDNPEACESCQ